METMTFQGSQWQGCHSLGHITLCPPVPWQWTRLMTFVSFCCLFLLAVYF